jgi:hypothetical protein
MNQVAYTFARAFADWLGVREARAFWKGRVALYAFLRTIGAGAALAPRGWRQTRPHAWCELLQMDRT